WVHNTLETLWNIAWSDGIRARAATGCDNPGDAKLTIASIIRQNPEKWPRVCNDGHACGDGGTMTWLVKVALDRPYTFIVMALMILIFGPLAAIRTPTDIFPNIGIPVVGVAFTYNGLSPDEMASRLLSNYERFLSTTVNDVEHVESTSMTGLGIVKIFFQPNVD